MATKTTALGSQYTQALKEYKEEQGGISMWEQALKGLQSSYQPQIEQIQKSTTYDISQAYANYKKSQMALMRNQQIGSGLREKMVRDLSSAYDASYAQARQQEAQTLAETQTAFATDVATLESQFADYGEQLAALDKAIYEKVGADITRARLGKDEGGLGHYETREDGVYLTAEGKSFYDKAFSEITRGGEAPTQSLEDYLLEQGEDELYKFYTSDPQRIRMLLGGEETADATMTTDELSRVGAAEAKKEYESLSAQQKASVKDASTYAEQEAVYTEAVQNTKKYQALKPQLEGAFKGSAGIFDEDFNKYSSGVLDKDLRRYLAPAVKDATGVGFNLVVHGSSENPEIHLHKTVTSLDEATRNRLEDLGFTVKTTESITPNRPTSYTIEWRGDEDMVYSLAKKLYNIK